ncbi:type I polyketide synthase [Streptomyces physcomitrii]|uniref:SDR family NAD(P)-dependent oxidoreductase n=1 Tax=Streptomyces physcomitrii TaxID=2724184 RepID=A0ABX1HAQ9_9ACTN|nr:type I polyketide synthase [Streptomyces physcomitrii]NKI45486.1 SDR family NAD(P)-dependent oxidoreductase [Streptomyces physcomitrii]
MAQSENNEDKLREYLKRVTTDLRHTRRQLTDLESRAHEPIAIVATACRMPGGVDTPEGLWQLVTDGVDTVSGLPTDRGWDIEGSYDPDPERRGTTYVREGAFLHEAAEFDAGFFEISPREALAMDPQQRLLLETTWEAFERAGIDPTGLRGSDTGVFVGASNQAYAIDGTHAPEGVEGHLLTGGSAAVLSGRVAYNFGFEGPAVSLDTMCSSSLVALHLAVRALRGGECGMAVVGGATVMATLRNFVEFSRQRGLAADGRCKPFAADADGTGWGEGVGVLLLERLSDARANGHRVLAVVRGSAINQDGASNGLTAPNGPSQQRVIRAALADAGVSPSEVDVVEAHGTGTKLGDPIEAQALLATYGRERDPEQPLWLGSVKSNIGHTQAASGVAGVIKMVEALRHGLLPKSLHAEEASPHVDWSDGTLRLLTEAVAWPESGRSRRAAVSSFGGSGTNAHLILEQAEEPEHDAEDGELGTEESPAPAAAAPGPLPWVLSARSEAALRAQAERLAGRVEETGASAVDVAHHLVNGRAALEERAVVVGKDTSELLTGLRALAASGSGAAVVRATAENPGEAAEPVFVFPGQGAQWVGMAVELLDSSPVFAERFGECAAALDEFVEWSLFDVVRGAEGAPGFDRVDVVQPALWAVMVSLAALWESYGVRPAAVVGHSQGEIAAACVAGALSLTDGARVVALRSRALTSLAGRGGMVSVAVDRAKAEELAGRWPGRVSVAALNGPSSTVVSGDADALDELMDMAESLDVRARRIEVDYASHSAHVDAIEEELARLLAPVVAREPEVPFLSTVTGEWVNSGETEGSYWFRNLRSRVQLEPVVRALVEEGHGVFVEVSPHPVLAVPVGETIEAVGVEGAVVGSLRRDQGGLERMYASLGEAWAHGVEVDWSPVFAGQSPGPIDLPTYAFQRQRYWLESAKAGGAADPVEEAFWRTVEEGDLGSFARTLGLAEVDGLDGVLPALAQWRRGRRERAALDGWRYRITWRDHGLPASGTLSGSWLLLAPQEHRESELVESVAAALAAAGADPVTLGLAADELDRADLGGRLTSAVADPGQVAGVVSLLALDERTAPAHEGATVGMTTSLVLLQALLDSGIDARTFFLTSEAVTTGTDEDPVRRPLQAALWGLGRVAALELPRQWGGLVDLPGTLDADSARTLCAVLAGDGTEDQIAVRGGAARIRRLVRAPLAGRTAPRAWRTSGAALVTGGTGGLGAHAARLLARNGAEHLVLTSRHGDQAPGAAELAAELSALGCRVTLAACDVADREALTRLVREVESDGPAIRSVVHTAGVGMLAPLADTDLDFFAEGARAKLLGARNLDALFDHDRLDAFVLYSSVAGTWGSGDHGAYSASNAYVDALAEHRRARGLTGVSLAWGIWSPEGGGMAVNVVREQLRWRGIPFMDARLAVDGLQQALDHDETILAIADIDWERFVPVFTAAHPRPLLHEVPEVAAVLAEAAEAAAPAADRAGGLRAELAPLGAAERDRTLTELVRTEVAAALGYTDSGEISVSRAFRELGFDSLTAVELRNRLNTATGLALPATIVFDHPNVRELAAHLAHLLLGDTAAEPAPAAPAVRASHEDEPIAIVSMGCRFPGGVRSPEEFWQLVLDESDAITGLPEDRGWNLDTLYDPDPDRAGTTYAREGGFLHDAAEFDAGFFGISPREALAMDPQQRLLLETSWETLERAGIAPDTLRGSDTGVFLGVSHQGYGARGEIPEGLEGHLITGTVTSIASGRVSYTLGLEGPAVTMDTGCSSALVALHTALRSLRSGECSLALTGGAAVMGEPIGLVGFSRQRGLAEDGRCKPFAAGADGMGMAEGVGMVLLERLSDARANGHRVLAVVRGSAINQDGASNGLTAPSGPSQQRVIRAALADAGVAASEVDVVEAHGTGTKLGDPIEAQALLATYGREHGAENPLWLGSVKSNIGHTQAASGMAGLIKMVQAMQAGILPRSLHAEEISPFVDWSTGHVALLDRARPWERTDRPYRAAVSSFGVSGTNAHLILEEAEPQEATPAPAARQERTLVPWVLSARTEGALRAQAERLADWAQETEAAPADIAHALLNERGALEERAVIVGDDRAELLAAVRALAAGTPAPEVSRGSTANPGDPASPVFVFPGQGAQWAGMAVELLDSSPVFAERFGECALALDEFVEWSLFDVVRGVEGAPGFDRVDVVQPALWAVMVSLAALWESYGVRPAAVVGHSQGEIAAACVAGALSLVDGARVVALRSRALSPLAGRGGMVSVALGSGAVEDLVGRWGTRLSVAAVNGPSSTVVSGDVGALDELMGVADSLGVRARRIDVDYASHSVHVDELQDELAELLAPVVARTPEVPFFSTVTGEWVTTAETDGSYWFRNLRGRVLLEPVVRALAGAGHGVFVEISPHPVLAVPVGETLEAAGGEAAVIGSLRRGDGGPARMYSSLGEAWARGVGVDWSPVFADLSARRVDLPTYAFQRQHYWLPSAEPGTAADGGAEAGTSTLDEEFWASVENNDVDSLAQTLGMEDVRSLGDIVPALSSWRRERMNRSTLDRWRYRVAWQPRADLPADADSLHGTWLVLAPRGHEDTPLVREVLAAVAARAPEARLVVAGEPEAERERMAELLRLSAEGEQEIGGVLSLLSLDESPWSPEALLPTGFVLMTALLQALGDARVDAALWCATRGAVSVRRTDVLGSPLQAMSWGLGRIAAMEYPQRWGGLVDLPETVDARAGRRLVAALSGALEEDHVALRQAGILARRLVRAGEGPRPDGVWQPRGTVLVTGGTGGLGAHVARWLARTGAEHLVLASRRGPDAPGAEELLAELTGLGTPATAVACDVSDPEAVRALLAGLPGETPLTAVVHTAGIIDDGVIDSLTPQRAHAVMRPKADAALVLDAATRGLDLDAFVLFSSMAGTLGGSGQGSYAAANAFLDALAARRRAEGLPATSIGWGTWGGGGMVSAEVAEQLRRNGVPPMDPELAIASLQKALDQDEEFLVVADVDWKLITARAFAALREFPEARRAAAPEQADKEADHADGPPLIRRLAAMAPEERRSALLTEIRTQAASVLGHPDTEAVPPGRAFRDLGFDSLTAVELRNRFAEMTGLRLPVTLVFDHPSAAALTAHLDAELFATGDAARGAETLPTRSVDDDPVVIVGMSCRFPGGVTSPEELWRLVTEGTDAISPFPEDRGWDVENLYDPDPERLGHSYARHGGFLHDADRFDPAFFGISPREAVAIDPQHRLLLETSWEAFERAGIDPEQIRGAQAGVFVGSNYNDYGSRAAQAPEGLEGYLATGSAGSVASGRIAYTFGLEGPAVTVDTACSSSLVALHLAVQALRSGECELALAGGVTVISTPDTFVEFSRQRALSPDGRCKPFAAEADGAGWAEGVGLLLLERLSDARRRGHTVLATVAGSAVNQDGASNGLTAPSGPAQQRVIRQALASAGLSPSDVDAVEAHGTGTTLGDPIEAGALLATYGTDRPEDRPLWLGALKSNIGHTQAASGVAGVIKMVMAMRHGTLPRTLHAENPSPHIDWSSGAVRLLHEEQSWAPGAGPRRAGVSSFGVSGTNAHVILQEAAPVAEAEPAAPASAGGAVLPWLLSARGEDALRAQARRLLDHLAAAPDAAPADLALSLATARAHLDDRAAILPAEAEADADADTGSLTEALAALAEGREHPRLATGRARGGKTAFLFSGQGAQHAGTGRALYATYEAFADALDAVCLHLDEHLEVPLRDVLFAEPGTPEAALLDRTAHTQAGLFAFQVALYRLLESLGVRPDVLLGHSVGEIAVAHVTGVLGLEDACRLVAVRGRLMGELPEGGAMVSVRASEEEVRAHLGAHADRVSVAALNGPTGTVISGDEASVLKVAEATGAKTRRLRVSHAFHSHRMDGMLADFAQSIGELPHAAPELPVVSTVTGRPVTAGEPFDPAYWTRQVREAVRFGEGVRTLEEQGVTTYVEIGPGGVLTALAGDCVEQEATLVPVVRRDTEETYSLAQALTRLHLSGHGVDWPALFAHSGARRVDLPTYAFQRRRYWLEATGSGREAARAGLETLRHPLLTAAVPLAGQDGVLLTGTVGVDTRPWLADHALADRILFPATAFLELAAQARAHVGAARIADLTLESPLQLPETGAVQLQVAVGAPDAAGERRLTVHSRPAGAQEWTRHAEGTLADTAPAPEPGPAAWPPAGAEELDVSGLYEGIAAKGFPYGPAFRGLRAAWRQGTTVHAEIVPEDGEVLEEAGQFGIHPALLDAALHTVALAVAEDTGPVVPFAFSDVTLHAEGPGTLRVSLTPEGEHTYAVRLFDSAGAPVADLGRLGLRPVDTSALAPAAGAGHLHEVRWVPSAEAEAQAPAGPLCLIGAEPGALPLPASPGADHHTDLAELLHSAAEDGVPATVLAAVPATAPGDSADATREALAYALRLVTDWLAEDAFTASRLVLLTRAAVATGDGAAARGIDPVQAAVWGLLRSARTENPGRFALIDHDGTAASLARLPQVLAGGAPETALREGRALAPRLVRTGAPAREEALDLSGPGTVLVTGAGGVLGMQVARHLAAVHGCRSLLLAGRRGAHTEGMAELCEELRDAGAEVTVAACDVADRDALTALLDGIPAERPLTAVVHTAGVLDDGVVQSLTPERLAAVLRAKADAALLLEETTRGTGAALVLFSSLAGTFGGAGQANYAAANAFLDAFAHRSRAEGRRVQSLAWGLWAERSGMTGKLDETDLRRVARGGIRPLETAEALALFDAALRRPEAVLAPALLDLASLRGADGTVPELVRELLPARQRRTASGRAQGGAPAQQAELLSRLARLDAEQRPAAVLDAVLDQAALVLGHDSPDTLDPDRGFLDIGFDSLTVVELRNRLSVLTGVRLPATLIFDHPSPQRLADHLLDRTAAAAKPAPSAAPATGTPSILTRLDSLEGEFQEAIADARAHEGLRTRLRQLLERLDRVEIPAQPTGAGAEEEVSDEELRAFLDGELGES